MTTPLRSQVSTCTLSLAEIKRFGQGWLTDCQYRQLSPATIEARRAAVQKLLWFATDRALDQIGGLEIKQFVQYVADGHNDPRGRWGNPHERTPNRPRTVKDYFGILKSFFAFLVAEGYIEDSPMGNLKTPISRADQIQPLSEQQIAALLTTVKTTKYAKRDTAILLLLLDSGIRATELCCLRIENVDVVTKQARVLGKGNKHRTVFFGKQTGKAIMAYLRGEDREPGSYLFRTEKSDRFDHNSLAQLVQRLGQAAGVSGVRCSPHTCRHSFAINFLRNGGNVFALQQILGHTEIKMTSRYIALAVADVQAQHISFSPMDRMGGRR